MENMTDGILLIDKAEDETSFAVVKKVRNLLGIRKIGHSGTLDPFATGLLIVLVGQGTKLSNFIMAEKKTYLATMRLGIETDTLDPTGRVVNTSEVPGLSVEYIRNKIRGFVGDIEQIPPIYSAVKYKGTRAYRFARKGVKITLKKRNVSIYSIDLTSVDLPDVVMKVTCSSGTYIRSLAADLGRELGPGAHLLSLRRLSSGIFNVKDALPSKEISAREGVSRLRQKIIPLRDALPGMHEIEMKSHLAKKVRHGYQPGWEDLGRGRVLADNKDENVKVVNGDELVAIIKIAKNEGVGHGKVKIERVFSEPMVQGRGRV